MRNKDFENSLRKNMDGYDSPLDVDAFWKSIEPVVDEINTKDNRKKWWPFIWGLTFIVIVASILLCVDFVGEDDGFTKNKVHVVDDVLSEDTIKNDESKIDQKRYFSDSEKFQIGSGFTGNEDNFNSKKIDFSKISNKATLFNSPLIDDSNLSIIKEEIKNEEKAITLIDDPNTLINEIKQKSINEKTGFEPLLHKKFYIENELIPIEINVATKSIINFPESDSFSKRDFVFGLELITGGGYVNKLLQIEDVGYQDFLISRKQTEKVKGYFQIGLNTKIIHKSGFEFSTGIHFTQLVEEFNFEKIEYVLSPNENGISHYQIGISGDTIPIFDSNVENYQKETYKKRYNNLYTMVDIPLVLGYHKRYQKISLGVQAGVFLNLRFKTKGLLLNELNEFISLDEQQSEVFKSKLKSSFYFAGVGKYYFKRNWALTVHPNFRFYPKSFTSPNSLLKQTYWTMGGNLGVEYLF